MVPKDINVQNWPTDVKILVPTYNSSELLDIFLSKLLKNVPNSCVLIVNDGSRDLTVSICKKHRVSCITLSKNNGKGFAVKTGFSKLITDNAKWIITMDADGQHSIDDLPKFIDTIKSKNSQDLIIGKRSRSIGKMPLSRIFSNFLTSLILSKLTGENITDSQCGYRAYSARLVKNIVLKYNRFEMESEVILKTAYLHLPITFIPVQTLYCSNVSHISHMKDTVRWLIAVFSVWIKLKLREA